MKKLISLTFFSLVILSLATFVSCKNKTSDNPVDDYVAVLDQKIKSLKESKSYTDLFSIQKLISANEAKQIMNDNKDYVLTDSDREKLKKSMNELFKEAFLKAMELTEVPEAKKKNMEAQLAIVKEAVDRNIDNARTLGEIGRAQ